MKKLYSLFLTAFFGLILFSSCEEEPDMAFDRVASPVLLVTTPVSSSETQATFYELDKSGILDQNVGIDSIPVPNLNIEVLSGGTSIGTFTTDASGYFVVPDSGSFEWVGVYKETAFRFIK
ncbi:MAG: hypothetical protein RIG62_23255 [Cyclobacteriaceae bacterium]